MAIVTNGKSPFQERMEQTTRPCVDADSTVSDLCELPRVLGRLLA